MPKKPAYTPIKTQTELKARIRAYVQSENKRKEQEAESKAIKETIGTYLEKAKKNSIAFPTGETAHYDFAVSEGFDYQKLDELLRTRITRGEVRSIVRNNLLTLAFAKLTKNDVTGILKEARASHATQIKLTPTEALTAVVQKGSTKKLQIKLKESA